MTCTYCARPSCRCQVQGQPAERHVRESLPRASRPTPSGDGRDAPETGFRGGASRVEYTNGLEPHGHKSRAEINRDYKEKQK